MPARGLLDSYPVTSPVGLIQIPRGHSARGILRESTAIIKLYDMYVYTTRVFLGDSFSRRRSKCMNFSMITFFVAERGLWRTARPSLVHPGGPPLRRRPRLRPGAVGPRRVPAAPPRRLVGVPFPDPLPDRDGANLG